MFNFLEQPWTLLGVAVLVLLGVLTFRSVWPERQKRWQWLLPVLVACLAFGLDWLVTTDSEKIHAATRAVIRAAQDEDCRAAAAWIAPDYHDSRHASKAELVKHCEEELPGPTIAKIRTIRSKLELSGDQAEVTLVLSIRFEEQSRAVRQYGVPSCLATVQLHLRKQPDRRWLINRAEILEVDQIPFAWDSVES